jgi:hypothetical protein
MPAAFLRCPSGLVSNKLGSPPFKGMKVPDVLDVSHFGRVQDFPASGGRGEPAKDRWPPGGLRILGVLGPSTGFQGIIRIRKMGNAYP